MIGNDQNMESNTGLEQNERKNTDHFQLSLKDNDQLEFYILEKENHYRKLTIEELNKISGGDQVEKSKVIRKNYVKKNMSKSLNVTTSANLGVSISTKDIDNKDSQNSPAKKNKIKDYNHFISPRERVCEKNYDIERCVTDYHAGAVDDIEKAKKKSLFLGDSTRRILGGKLAGKIRSQTKKMEICDEKC